MHTAIEPFNNDKPSKASHYDRYIQEAERHFVPLNVMLELTHRCHLNCVHCYLEDNHEWRAKAQELTAEEFCQVIDQLVDAGCLFLTLSGGEIFLRDDTLVIARYARSKGLALRLYTSGTLMTPTLVEEITQLHPLSVEFSIYSADNPDLHDSIIQIPGSHQKTLEAIRILSRTDIPVVIKTPLMREVFSEYPKILELAKELGVFYKLDPTVSPKNDGDLSPCHLRLTQDQLLAMYADPNLPSAPEIQALSEGKIPHKSEDEVCDLGKTACAISPLGDVYPTLGFPWSAGNVRETLFREIWENSPLFKRLREVQVKDLSDCSGCEKFSYCDRCCMWALMDEGDFFGGSLWACEIASAKEKAAGLPSDPTPFQLKSRDDNSIQRTQFTTKDHLVMPQKLPVKRVAS